MFAPEAFSQTFSHHKNTTKATATITTIQNRNNTIDWSFQSYVVLIRSKWIICKEFECRLMGWLVNGILQIKAKRFRRKCQINLSVERNGAAWNGWKCIVPCARSHFPFDLLKTNASNNQFNLELALELEIAMHDFSRQSLITWYGFRHKCIY